MQLLIERVIVGEDRLEIRHGIPHRLLTRVVGVEDTPGLGTAFLTAALYGVLVVALCIAFGMLLLGRIRAGG